MTRSLPTGWREATLSELASFAAGRTPARARSDYWAPDTTSGVPWVSIGDMRPHGVVTDTAEHVSALAFSEVFAGRRVPKGTLLMSFKLTIGRIATLGVDACHNEAIVSISPKGVDQRFLGYYLSQVDYAEYQDRAIKGQTLNRDKLSSIRIALPPEQEQRRIAAVLSLVQLAIENEEKTIAATRALKQAALAHVFTRGLRAEPQRETEIGPVPASWDVRPMAELREFLQYGTSVKCDYGDAGHAVLRIPNVIDGRIDWSDLKRCTLDADTATSLLLQRGDVLFIRTNGVRERVGTCAVYDGDPADALFASYLIRARPKPLLNPHFFQYYTATSVGASFLGGRASPASDGKFNVNTKTIDSVLVPVPSRGEQDEIVTRLRTIDSSLRIHERRHATLSDLFGALLDKLMTGEIRVDELDIDTSAVEAA